jgi:DNA repair protein RadC
MKTQLPARRESDPFTAPRLHVIPEAPKGSALQFVMKDEIREYAVRGIDMSDPEYIERFFRDVVENSAQYEAKKEHLVLFIVNSRLQLVGWHIVSKGGLTEATAGIREIVRPVLVAGEYGFAIAHNHPSGDPSPSRPDEIVTRRLVEACELIGLKFLDHLVIGDKRQLGGRPSFYSFRQAGLIY